jgi:regulator of sirC expression with transglutaminase-like and TPR domain
MTVSPAFCRLEAYEFFAAQLSCLEEQDRLLQAAIAVSLHALDDARPGDVVRQIDSLASKVRSRVRSRNPQAIVAHLHDILFDEEGFRGNTEDYYSPLNSYLPVVLETKSGLPITLSLIYKSVADRIGLRVEGVNAPGHFLVRVYAGRDVMLIDPFHGGQSLSPLEALSRIALALQRPVCADVSLLGTAKPVDWLARLVGNLRCTFASCDCRSDFAAMTELAALLPRKPK